MKKLLFILLISSLFINSFAQKLSLGIFADPQITWLTSNTKKITTENVGFGYNFGLTIDNYFAKNYALATGISLNTLKGGMLYQDSLEITTTDGIYELDKLSILNYNIQYLNIPVAIRLKTNEIGYSTYYATVGFNTYFNLDGKISESTDLISNEIMEKEVLFYNLDYFFGIGFLYSLGSSASINFGINYGTGFIDIFKDENNTAFTKNVSFRIGMIF